VAGTGNTSISISDWLLITSAIVGPVLAVQAQKWIERGREKRNRRLWIFQTLMATRAMRASSNEHVQALNLISLNFAGQTQAEKTVRNAWGSYFDHLSQPIEPNRTEDQWKIHNDRATDLLIDLLDAMSKALKYEFTKVELRRGAYYPQGHADERSDMAIIRKSLVKLLNGGPPLPMAVVSFPFSENAINAQVELQTALTKTLSGDSPLRVIAEMEGRR
jgi:hypothetical protein